MQVCARDLNFHIVEGNTVRLTDIKEVTLITCKELGSSSSVPGEKSGFKLFRDVYCFLSQELS